MSESSPREPGVRGLQGPTSGFRRPSQVCRDYRLVTTPGVRLRLWRRLSAYPIKQIAVSTSLFAPG